MGEAKRRSAAGIRLRRLYSPSNLHTIVKLVIPAGAAPPPRDIAMETIRFAETIRVRVRTALVRASEAGSLERMLDRIDAVGVECATAFSAAVEATAKTDPARGKEMATTVCRRGCAFCCHVDVDVTPLEAIRLWRRTAATAIAESAARRPPCPMLVDGACSQYEARPYSCRATFSPDAKQCEEGYVSDGVVPVPSLNWPRAMASSYITGELAALDDLNLAGHMVQLRGALAVMRGDNEAALRWLNGADIFPRRAAP
jgi:hypothetical protein